MIGCQRFVVSVSSVFCSQLGIDAHDVAAFKNQFGGFVWLDFWGDDCLVWPPPICYTHYKQYSSQTCLKNHSEYLNLLCALHAMFITGVFKKSFRLSWFVECKQHGKCVYPHSCFAHKFQILNKIRIPQYNVSRHLPNTGWTSTQGRGPWFNGTVKIPHLQKRQPLS